MAEVSFGGECLAHSFMFREFEPVVVGDGLHLIFQEAQDEACAFRSHGLRADPTICRDTDGIGLETLIISDHRFRHDGGISGILTQGASRMAGTDMDGKWTSGEPGNRQL